jgi:DNA-binding NarL/FixJ family response regulator
VNTLVVIEDHAMMRRGLAAYFSQTRRWTIIGEAASLNEAAALFAAPAAQTALPDMVLLDIDLQGSWGLDLIPRLKKLYQNRRLPVIIYSVFSDYVHAKAALRSGAAGYVCKSQGEAELETAMEIVLKGGSAYSPELLAKMEGVSDLLMWLTKRERQVFELVQNSKTNKEIAEILGIRIRTIENYLSVIYDKIGVKSRRELENL